MTVVTTHEDKSTPSDQVLSRKIDGNIAYPRVVVRHHPRLSRDKATRKSVPILYFRYNAYHGYYKYVDYKLLSIVHVLRTTYHRISLLLFNCYSACYIYICTCMYIILHVSTFHRRVWITICLRNRICTVAESIDRFLSARSGQNDIGGIDMCLSPYDRTVDGPEPFTAYVTSSIARYRSILCYNCSHFPFFVLNFKIAIFLFFVYIFKRYV